MAKNQDSEKTKWTNIKTKKIKILKEKLLKLDMSCPEEAPDKVLFSIRRILINKETNKESFTRNGIGGIALEELNILIDELTKMKRFADDYVENINRRSNQNDQEEDYFSQNENADDPDMF